MIIKHGSYRVIYNSLMDLWDEAVMGEAQIRAGICPDCGNDKCMADGKTGLWCPNCDASYLLDEHNTGTNHEAHNGESSSKEATREINHRRDSHPDGHGDDVRSLIQYTAV